MTTGAHVAAPDPYLIERVNSRSPFHPEAWFRWWARDRVTPAVLRRREGIAEFRALLAGRDQYSFRKVP